MSNLFPDKPIDTDEFRLLSHNYQTDATRKRRQRDVERRMRERRLDRCQRITENNVACQKLFLTDAEGDDGESESPRLPTVGGMPEAGHKP